MKYHLSVRYVRKSFVFIIVTHEVVLQTLSLLKRAQERTLVPLIADQRSNMFRMRRTTTRLECSLLRLDELVLIFHMSYHNFQ